MIVLCVVENRTPSLNDKSTDIGLKLGLSQSRHSSNDTHLSHTRNDNHGRQQCVQTTIFRFSLLLILAPPAKELADMLELSIAHSIFPLVHSDPDRIARVGVCTSSLVAP